MQHERDIRNHANVITSAHSQINKGLNAIPTSNIPSLLKPETPQTPQTPQTRSSQSASNHSWSVTFTRTGQKEDLENHDFLLFLNITKIESSVDLFSLKIQL